MGLVQAKRPKAVHGLLAAVPGYATTIAGRAGRFFATPKTPERTAALVFNRAELGGALGDLGTFIPLLAGMVNRCNLQLGPALFCAGLMNVVTGLAFGIPMPVQPMKAIAAVAIAEGMNSSQIVAAGIATGLIVLVLGASGAVEWLNRVIPKSVVRGLQLAIGLKLLTGGFKMIVGTHAIIAWDSISMGVLCIVLVLLLCSSKRVPAALLIFAIGLIALLASRPGLVSEIRIGMAWHLPDLTNRQDWLTGLWRGTLPQVPLTLLNSVIAVCALSLDLFPKKAAAPRRVAVSVGLMNLICCPLGAMPMCHGAGGLAAQHRFGARSGGSVVMLGIAKVCLALLLGGSLMVWLHQYPQSVLGVLLLFGGLELALVCRDQRLAADFLVMTVTAAACIAINTAVGFLVGWATAALLWWGLPRPGPLSPQDP